MPQILIAEDEESIRELLREFLEGEGFTISEATDGLQVLAALAEKRADLVLMDVRMPKKTGLDVLRESRHDGEGLPIIVMTAFGTANMAIEAIQLGAYDYIPKPFDLNHVPRHRQQLLQAAGTHQPGRGAARPARRARSEGADRRHHPGDDGRLQDDRAGGALGCERPDHRRDRGRERIRRRDDPQEFDLQPRPADQGQLRRAAGDIARKRAFRPRERLLHRGDRAAQGALRAGEQGLDLPRRDRRDDPADAEEAPPRPPGARVRAGRRHDHRQGRCAGDRRDEQEPDPGGRRRALPPGSLLPPQRHQHPPPPPAGARDGHSAAGRALLG